MKYYITKDRGVGWDAFLKAPDAWGVSKNQLKRAEKVTPGDTLLHYIDRVHVWAGYSTATGMPRKNDRDSQADWLAALPYVIPIERGIWLKKHEISWLKKKHETSSPEICELPKKQFHRQVTFTSLEPSDAQAIIAAINVAQSAVESEVTDPLFDERWNAGAESYYWEIERETAGGKCRLCGEDVADWAFRVKNALLQAGVILSNEELEAIRGGFLDVAHIIPRHASGPLEPDNVRALCPTCHRIIDRLGDRGTALLRKI